MPLLICNCLVCGDGIGVEITTQDLNFPIEEMKIAHIDKVALINKKCPSCDDAYFIPSDTYPLLSVN